MVAKSCYYDFYQEVYDGFTKDYDYCTSYYRCLKTEESKRNTAACIGIGKCTYDYYDEVESKNYYSFNACKAYYYCYEKYPN